MRPSRVILVVALAAVVGGLAFIKSLTPGRKAEPEKSEVKVKAARPVEFAMQEALPGKPHTRFWRNVYELGESGHFDYWFVNENPEPVRLGIKATNCTCQGAVLATLEPQVWAEFLALSALSSPWSLGPPNLLSVAALVPLQQSTKFSEVKIKDEQLGHEIPAAGPGGPQVGILRISWKGQQAEEPKQLRAEVVTQLPKRDAVTTTLSVGIAVRLPVEVTTLGGGTELSFGELRAGQSVRRELLVWSSTRRDLKVRLDWAGDPDPCLSFEPPVPIAPGELDAMLGLPPGDDASPVRSAFRVGVRVAESVPNPADPQKPFRLDLGLVERTLEVRPADAPTGPARRVPVRGTIRGEVSVRMESTGDRGKPLDGRIDFGPPFRASDGRSVKAEVIGSAAGIDVEEVAEAHSPPYLKAKLTRNPPRGDEPPTWELVVTIPEGALSGGVLPADAHVVLRTKGANPRRFRIPVAAQASNGRGGIKDADF